MTTRDIQSVCVYCGSRTGENPAHAQAAEDLGTALGRRGNTLVYGAGSVGLMGIAARAAMKAGGKVVGIIPDHLDDVEITESGLTETIITPNMHERKKIMFDRSDAFVVLPGGFGTMDEMFEILTWAQLKLHNRPIIVLDSDGFWSPLFGLIDNIVSQGFAERETAEKLTRCQTVSDALQKLDDFKASDTAVRSDLF